MNELAIIENGALTDINKALKNITKKHKKVSSIATPKAFIKQKMGMDYVEYSVMRDIADKEYPGWSWTVIKTEFAGTEAYVIHEGDATAAHRVQKKRGTNDYVDLGNDIKAANTDCIKKAFNMYMNICDDVYRNQVEDPELTDEQKNNIFETAKISGRDTEVMEKVKSGVINAFNYKASMAKLERLAQ
jgi:hypothetical protein